MTRWKKDAKEFSVSLSNDGSDGLSCRLPKPISEMLGKPEKIKFIIRGKGITVTKD
ncbi:hypothetical protein [Nitrosopumilus sp.]|uniref:hypothetical protein n=1 Tax=Nitrosopumilus sp. TaxID=2024843 RepID=UPI003D12130A